MTVSIRPMISSDQATIVRLEREIFPDPWSVTVFEDIFQNDDSSVVGYTCILVVAGECHLANIAVVPEFRRKSVAKQLLEHILEVARQKECGTMLLEVRVSNREAIAFYEKNRFAQKYVRNRYYHDPTEDAAVMIRQLD